MTIPNFLSNVYAPFRYYAPTTVFVDADVAIPVIGAELVASGWTLQSTNTWRSPSDTAGHWMQCAFMKSATHFLRMYLTDQDGVAICDRSMYAHTSIGITLVIYTGKYHCYIESVLYQASGGTTYLAAFLLDTTPDSPASVPSPVVGNGTFGPTGFNDGVGLLQYWYAKDNAASQYASRLKGYSANGTMYPMTTPSGRAIYDECMIYQLIGGSGVGNYVWTGRFCQALLGPNVPDFIGAERRVPIDDGTVGVFKSTVLYTYSGNYPYYARMYMRKS